ncbi:MAG: CrcB family protein [Acidimicrobiales bacterium]|jgi:fluoride ion exporter CrcB/FEX|nr:CrcB family protein [Acidimicrobiales bacterium]
MIAIGFIVAAGAGAVFRWRLSDELGRLAGTFAANTLGSFVLGLLFGQTSTTHTIVGVAGLGALTTWSTLIAELAELAAVDRTRAVRYGLASLVVGVFAGWLGLQLG